MNANYVPSKTRGPVQTICLADPAVMIAITAVFMLVNIVYYVVVDKTREGAWYALSLCMRAWGAEITNRC